MFRLNTIVIVSRIKNVDLNDLNRYLFEIDWNINKQNNWLSIQCDIDNFLYFINDDCSCVIEIHDFKSFDKKFNNLFERNLSRYRWQNRRRKSYFRLKNLFVFWFVFIKSINLSMLFLFFFEFKTFSFCKASLMSIMTITVL